MVNDADTKILDVTSLQPLYHLNLMVKQILQGDYVKSLNASLAETVESSKVSDMVVFSLEGDQINKLSPYVVPVESIFNTGSTVFAEANDQSMKGKTFKDKMLDATIFITTRDTEVVDAIDVGRKFDLVIDTVCEAHDIVNLQPVTPSVWAGRTISVENDKTLLNAFPVSIAVPILSKYGQCILAFRSHWPDKACEWRTRTRISGWPDARTVEAVVSEGVHVVPMNLAKKPDVLDEPEYVKSVQNDKSLWLISFAEAEKEILRFLPESAKDCYLLFRLLVDSFLKEQGGLPTSCLKHLFFHACETLTTERWKKEPGVCLMYLLQKLTLSLKTKLPHYFVPQKNLLQSLSRKKIKEVEHQIELLSFQPLLSVFQFIDEHDLGITELGPLLDDLIEDVCRFNNHMSVSISVEDSFVPALHCMLHDYVLQNEFENAMKVVNEVLERLEMPDNDEYIVSVITSSFSSQHIRYAWCLALYIELANNRKGITKVLCDNYKTVPISEVFGPEIVDELGDTVVPEIFSIPRGDLTFPEVVATVLEKSGTTKLLSKCLRYYIETYQDMFGSGPCLANAAGGCRIPGCFCGLTKLFQLQDLYVRLYNSYLYSGRPTEFKDLVPKFTEVVEVLKTPMCNTNLVNILTGVGEIEKAMKLRRKLNTANAYSYEDANDDMNYEF